MNNYSTYTNESTACTGENMDKFDEYKQFHYMAESERKKPIGPNLIELLIGMFLIVPVLALSISILLNALGVI